MSNLRPLMLTLAALIVVAVIGLAAQGEAQQPVFPDTPEGRRAAIAESVQRTRDLIQRFVNLSGDPCSLPTAESGGHYITPYIDVPALINDTDLIVLAHPVTHTVEAAPPGAIAGAVLVSLDVTEILKGKLSSTSISAGLGTSVTQIRRGSLVRVVGYDLDSCTSQPTVLFLNQTKDADVYHINHQGWFSTDPDKIQAGGGNRLFDSYPNAQTLVEAIKEIVLSQENERLPKGLLICNWNGQAVCPGDLFNPYQTFELDSAISVRVVTSDPGPRTRVVADVDIQTGSELSDLLRDLDVDTASAPLGMVPDDNIRLVAYSAQLVNDRFYASFDYSPSTGMIQIRPFSGQFPAPPAFQQAMERFLPTTP